jgi:hypothetical protein
VTSIREGREALKVPHGQKTFYRRIAGNKDLSRDVSCDLVIETAEEDIKKEYPSFQKVPYTVEVIYYDEINKDCAVTLSVDKKYETNLRELASYNERQEQRRHELYNKTDVTEEEAAELVKMKSETASKFALTGLTREDFEKFSKDKVTLNRGKSLCNNSFKTDIYSVHGLTEVCWSNNHVKGYCTTKTRQCWVRTP